MAFTTLAIYPKTGFGAVANQVTPKPATLIATDAPVAETKASITVQGDATKYLVIRSIGFSTNDTAGGMVQLLLDAEMAFTLLLPAQGFHVIPFELAVAAGIDVKLEFASAPAAEKLQTVFFTYYLADFVDGA